MKTRFRCVDLFCGVGGLTRGLLDAGIPVVAGYDLDARCKYPYEANNTSKFFLRSIEEIDGKEVAEHFDDAEVKILAGCAPCQPFSSYSQRYDQKRDGKWKLLVEFQRLVEESQPDIVTMENVPLLKNHLVFKEFVEKLKYLGFFVWAQVVQSADYGVPQSRKRLVLLASKFGPLELLPSSGVRTTVRETIENLPPIAAGETSSVDALHTSASLSEKNRLRIQNSIPGGTWSQWPSHLIADCHKKDSGQTYPSVYGRMEWDAVSPAMTTQCFAYGSGRFGHPEQDRAISLREAALLQSFPKSYEFLEKGEKIKLGPLGRLIGNAVPVGLAKAVGLSIHAHFNQFGSEAAKEHKAVGNA